jgi:hypothetical protein
VTEKRVREIIESYGYVTKAIVDRDGKVQASTTDGHTHIFRCQ